MTKIGIFGDSFGAPTKAGSPELTEIGMQYHWARLFANDINATLSVEAISGSSLHYAFTKFLTSHHLYDIIFFTVTDCMRYPSPVCNDIFITSMDQLEHKKEEFSDNPLIQDELDRVAGWFTSHDYGFLITAADLMVEKILSLRPDTILVPVNEGCMSLEKFKDIGLDCHDNLVNLYYEQIDQLGIFEDTLNRTRVENYSYVSGHFVPEMHEHFYPIIKERHASGVWNWKKPPKLNFAHSAEDYYPFI